jgi:predicted amidohydrolase
MKIAAAAYPIDWHNRWNDFVGKLRVWVRTAAEQGAELLVFPEYGAMELASLAEEANSRDLAKSAAAVIARIGDVDDLHSSLAREFGVHICAASGPVRRDDGQTANRARLFAPDGSRGRQDKLILTPFEREEWTIAPGRALTLFDTALGRMGVLIGYDAEFPLVARALVAAGAEILLVPSFTRTMPGWWRVRIAAMARALEGQCVVAQAVTLSDADWLAAAGKGVGAPGIFVPPDRGMPEDGVVATGKPGTPGWTYGEVSLEALREVRASGAARNVTHWEEQDARLEPVAVETLGTPAQA